MFNNYQPNTYYSEAKSELGELQQRSGPAV